MKVRFGPRSTRIRTPGLRPRCDMVRTCDHATCDRPLDHPGSHRWSTRKTSKPAGKKFELRKAASEIINDPRYQRRLLHDLRDRTLPPAVECLLWYYAIGKPVEEEDDDMLTLEQRYRRLTRGELHARAVAIVEMLSEKVPEFDPEIDPFRKKR